MTQQAKQHGFRNRLALSSSRRLNNEVLNARSDHGAATQTPQSTTPRVSQDRSAMRASLTAAPQYHGSAARNTPCAAISILSTF